MIRAGVATQEITPRGEVELFGYPRIKRPATGVHDPLMVSALHLRDATAGLLLISLDLACLDPHHAKSIRQAVSRAVSIPADHIFIGCTQTHAGPATASFTCWMDDVSVPEPDPKYLEFVQAVTVTAAASAVATSQPAELICATVPIPPGEGFASSDVGVIGIRKPGGDYIGMVSICDICPNALGRDFTEISADYPYYARHRLGQHFSRDLAVLHFTAPSADRCFEHPVPGEGSAQAERMGRLLAGLIIARLESAQRQEFCQDVHLAGQSDFVCLEPRRLPSLWDAQVAWGNSRAVLEDAEQRSAPEGETLKALDAVVEAEGTVNLVRAEKNQTLQGVISLYQPAEVQLLQIGDISLIGMPGSLASEYGRRLRSRGHVFVASLVNGELQGNIVTAEQESLGRHGLLSSPFGADAGSALVASADHLLEHCAHAFEMAS